MNSLFVQNASKNWQNSHMFTVSGMSTHFKWCCVQSVNAPCITVLYLALKFDKTLFTPLWKVTLLPFDLPTQNSLS